MILNGVGKVTGTGVETADGRGCWHDTRFVGIGLTHQSVIKTTFVLYFAMLAGIRAACNAMGAVSIIGRWKPFV